MYIFGAYISVVELLLMFSGFIVVVLLYLAYEINKLKKIERRLESIEEKMEEEETMIGRDIKKILKRKKRKR